MYGILFHIAGKIGTDSASICICGVGCTHYFAISGKVITLILGIRFLTDHLNGDTYFRVHRDGQNLDRARVQFKLVESMLEQEEAMKSFIAALG